MDISLGPLPGQRFRHYKGGEYDVVAMAHEEATLRPVVVYRAADGTTWTRPIEDWSAEVEQDGRKLPRFSLLS